MSIDPEVLMAYADGELDEVAARRVEKAMAEDPAIAAQVERHRALRERLRAHFGPVAEAPIPDALAELVRGSAQVVDLAAVRRANAAPPAVPPTRWWRIGGAVAAALVLGVVVGQGLRLGGEGDFAARNGRMVASGKVAVALDRQLAANQPADAPVRLLVSFRDAGGDYCRAFSSAAQSGIACRKDAEWEVRQLRVTTGEARGDYRQAASDASALMADAQALMAGEPLDAAGESAAQARGWRSN